MRPEGQKRPAKGSDPAHWMTLQSVKIGHSVGFSKKNGPVPISSQS